MNICAKLEVLKMFLRWMHSREWTWVQVQTTRKHNASGKKHTCTQTLRLNQLQLQPRPSPYSCNRLPGIGRLHVQVTITDRLGTQLINSNSSYECVVLYCLFFFFSYYWDHTKLNFPSQIWFNSSVLWFDQWRTQLCIRLGTNKNPVQMPGLYIAEDYLQFTLKTNKHVSCINLAIRP